MTRYSSSRSYWTASVVAVALGALCAWLAVEHTPAAVAAVLFALLACCLLFLASRPQIEIDRHKLKIGRRTIPWPLIRRVDRTGWMSPLLIHVTLDGGERILLIYPGDLDSANSLLRHIRRQSTRAMIDGIPYPQFWGKDLADSGAKEDSAPSAYPLFMPEDEEEIRRLFHRLKTVGHLDSNSPGEEK